MDKLKAALNLIADSAETGYTAVFTYATKEFLSRHERGQLVNLLRQISEQEELVFQRTSNTLPIGVFSGASRMEEIVSHPSSSGGDSPH